MIPLIVFYLHIVGFTYAFTREYQREGVSGGFLTVGFLVLIFSVGWSISSFAFRNIIDEAGLGLWLNRDALSLLAVSAGEGLLYYFYFGNESRVN
ncbi:MAG: hypothetical protein HYV29_14245 [Ignavibacteriales bacterium]|nr:hypothetical protein [Ignavibacteriales bacterium]